MWLKLSNVSHSFGGPTLLDRAQLTVEANERIALVGRNGVGKSSLLNILAKRLTPDEGEVQIKSGLRTALLEQSLPVAEHATVFQIVVAGLGELGEKIADYMRFSKTEQSNLLLKKLEKLHDEIELAGGWSIDAKVRKVAQQLNLELDAKFATLSGGVKRRALLARAIVSEPDLLLLDEPTNHLDIVQIQWLESYLENFPGSVIFISHDRRFVERLARRVVEIDRGQLLSWHGSYQNYLKRQQKLLLEQEEQFKLEDKKLASEEAWIRKGIKARRTRDQGRVRALQKLRETRRARRSKMGDVNINVDSELISGKRVFEVEGLSYQYSDQTPLIKNFSCEVCRGDKIAIVGANGCGKSTLVKLLLKELPPSSGRIHQGTKIQLAYFDQLQQQLDENMTLLDFVGEGRTQIEVAGTQRHIMGYLQDFLFSPQAVRSPIKVLSGGERNRLILAKILSKPANLLVLDEPTNDLDIETLEILESMLVAYSGTLLLVSHDREFIDRVATNIWLFEGNGKVTEYIGGYEDMLMQSSSAKLKNIKPNKDKIKKQNIPRETKSSNQVKLSYKQERERQQLPDQIELLEHDIDDIQTKLSDPDFYKTEGESIAILKKRLSALQEELELVFQRWEELERLTKK